MNPDNRPAKQRNKPHHTQSQKLVAPTVAITVALTGAHALAQGKEVLTAPPIEVREQRPGYTVPNLGLSRLPGPIRDIPQSITVLPRELMQEQGVTNLAAIFWVQSMVRDESQRTLLFELDMALHQVNQAPSNHAAVLALTNCYHNLLRRDAEV
jgi:hypothetical protein